MGNPIGRSLAALSLAALTSLSLTACVEFEGVGDSEVGTVSIGLAGQGASGAIYRLRDATFTVAGPSSTLAWHTEDDPDRTSLSANVVVGNYTAALASGWRLEKLVMGQPPTDVTATLVSPNPAAFTVSTMMRTEVPFRFAVEGGVIDMSQGYDITIDIDELATSIVTLPSSLTLAEGTSAAIAVRLSSAPPAPITIAVASSDASTLVPVPATLTFTPANFALPQIVTVNAVQDLDNLNEMVAVALSGPGLPAASVAIIVTDDDTAMQAIITTTANLSVTEGGSATIGVRLAAPPAGPVIVSIASSDPGAIGAAPMTLGFNPASFSTFQTVTVTGLADADTLDEAVTLTFGMPGAPATTIAVTVADDDAQMIIANVVNLTVIESGSATFAVRLAAQPSANVTVQLVVSDPGAASVTPMALTFTPANYATAQVVTVAGLDDADALDELVQIMLVSPGLPTALVHVNVIDND